MPLNAKSLGLTLGITVSAVVLLICGGVVATTFLGLRTCSKAIDQTSRPIKSPGTATLAAFESLQEGMSYDEVCKIIGGRGSEMSRVSMFGTTTVIYGWDGDSLGANMNATFQNDKLVSKAQFFLR